MPTSPGITSYDANVDTPHRFRPVVGKLVFSSGSKRLMDLTAINILKANGVEHIVFVSSKKVILPKWWEETEMTFQRFPVQKQTGLPNVEHVQAIMGYIQGILSDGDNGSVLVCNYSDSDNEYAVHIVTSLLYTKYCERLGVPFHAESKRTVEQRVFRMASFGSEDRKRRILIRRRIEECVQALFPGLPTSK
jgi:hypothetical protein